MTTATTQHKNNVFVTLFSNPTSLLSLYNALAGTDLPLTTDVEIITLESIIFNAIRNDIAFLVEGRLVVLIEHQATINENMPLRLLLYVAHVYEKLTSQKDAIYREKLMKIPRPDFIVLYNGTAPFPDEKILHLSTAFEEPIALDSLGGQLELSVRVVNINDGRNAKVLSKCEDLMGYATFVAKARYYLTQTEDLTTALTKAIQDCIGSGVLVNFLKTHSTEVLNMFNQEFDIHTAKRVWQEEAWETGLEEGMEKGIEKGMEKGIEKGMEKGIEKGIEKGALSEALRMAKVLLQRNLPLDLVAETTQLPKEQLQALLTS